MNNVAAGFSLLYIMCNNCILCRLKSAATKSLLRLIIQQRQLLRYVSKIAL